MFAFHHVRNVCESPGQKPGFRFRRETAPAGLEAGAVIPMRQAGWLTGASINAPSDLPFPCELTRWQGPAYAVRNRLASGSQLRRPYFGGCSSLLSQLITRSVFSGSGRSQSKHCNVRGPSPPGGSAKVRGAPHMGQDGRFAWPMEQFCQWSKRPSIPISN